jgi:hypothetical protein
VKVRVALDIPLRSTRRHLGHRPDKLPDQSCRRDAVRQVTQGVGLECHESIDDANYDGGSCYVHEKAKER